MKNGLPGLLLSIFALLGGCQEEKLVPATQLVVVVNSDLELGTQLSSVRVSVQTSDGASTVASAFPFVLKAANDPATAKFTLPLSFGIRQPEGGADRVRVVVAGYGPVGPNDAEILVVEQKAVVSFERLRALSLSVFLGSACYQKLCGDEPGADLVCYARATKEAPAGACGGVPVAETEQVERTRELDDVLPEPPVATPVALPVEMMTSSDSGTTPPSPPPPTPVPIAPRDVDLLLVIDNSGSMSAKQVRLAQQLPRMLEVLTTGDRCAGRDSCPYTDATTPPRFFQKLSSLHVGVVTSNAGGMDVVTTSPAVVASCSGVGDDGKLQQNLSVAVNGVVAGRAEFSGFVEGDIVLAPSPDCASLSNVPTYQQFVAGQSDLAAVQRVFGCVSRVGVRGCPFEQQLESAWKALAPSAGEGADHRFSKGTRGQGDRYNAGFLRADAVLAVLMLTDEDDCSITDAGKVLFDTEDPTLKELYGELNMRCGLNGSRADLVHDVERFVRGFASLKPGHPERFLFGAIAGVPAEAIADGSSLDAILALPVMRFAEDASRPGFPRTSCTLETEAAYPPVRIVQVAKALGDQGYISSICSVDYGPAIDGFLTRLVKSLN